MAYDEKRVKQMQDHLAGGTQLTGDDLKSADYNADGKFNIKDVSAYQKQYSDTVKEIATEKYDAQQEKPIKVEPVQTEIPIIGPNGQINKTPGSTIVDEAMNKLNSQLGSVSQWDSKAMGVLNEIENQKPFKYDLQGDVLYQQYKEQYIDNADRAMRDTVGQVSSMTGGYGNSYAQTAGQQTYNEVMGGLNDIVPELYQIAQERYDAELQNKKDMLGIYHDMGESAYNRYRDEVNDNYRDKEFGLEVEKFDETKKQNAITNDLNQSYLDLDLRKQDELEKQNAIENEHWGLEFGETVRQFNEKHALDEASFEEDVRQFNESFSLEEKQTLYNSGWAKIEYGIMPSKAERLAMDMSETDCDNAITKAHAMQSVSSGGGSGSKSNSYSNTYLKQLYKDGDYDTFFSILSESGDVIAAAQNLGLSKHEINYLNDEKLSSIEQVKYMLKNHGKEDYSDKEIEQMVSGAYSKSEFYSFANYGSKYDSYADYLSGIFKKFIIM